MAGFGGVVVIGTFAICTFLQCRLSLGAFPLPLPLACAFFLGFAGQAKTARAANTGLILDGIQSARGQGLAAAAAQLVATGLNAMGHRHALVKHKAFALPAADLGGYGFQVFQDATFEVINLLHALAAQKGGGLFTADTASAKHGHLARLGRIEEALQHQPCGQLRKAFQSCALT